MRTKAYGLVLCLGLAVNVSAQEIEHETVTVKDNNKTKNMNVAQSIESVDNGFIMKNIGGSLGESLEKIPGVSSITIGSSQSKPVIRGLGFNRIAVIENNVRHEAQQWGSDHGLEIDQYAVENAEIIKGPSSLEYGSDAIGGVLKINTLKVPAKNSLSGDIKFTGKTANGLLSASTSVSGRKESVFFTLKATAQDYADYKIPTDYVNVYSYKIPLNDHRLRNTAGKEYDFSFSTGYIKNSQKIRFTISDVMMEGGFFANAHGLEPRNVDEEYYDKSNRDIQQPSQKVNHLKTALQYDKWSTYCNLAVNIAYQHNKREEYSQYVSHGYMPTVCPEDYNGNPDIEYLYDKNTVSANVTATFPLKYGNLKMGTNSEFQHNRIGGRCFIIPEYKTLTFGMFTSIDYPIGNWLNLQGGVRYDIGKIKTYEYKDWFASKGEYLERAENLDKRFKDFSFSSGIAAKVQKFNFKISAAKGFRMPLAKELAANGVNYHSFSYEVGNSNLKSESSYQLDGEINYMSRLWSITLSPFAGYFDNYIYLNPTPKFDRYYGNGNQIYNYTQCKVFRYGGEADVRLTIDNRFVPFHHSKIELVLNGEYLHSKQLSGDKKGYSLPFSPPETFGFETTYTRRLKNADKEVKTKVKEISCGFDVKCAAKQTDIVPPENPTDGYQVYSVSATLTSQLFGHETALSARIRNLFNTVYYNHTSYYRLINVPEQGTNIVINLTFKF